MGGFFGPPGSAAAVSSAPGVIVAAIDNQAAAPIDIPGGASSQQLAHIVLPATATAKGYRITVSIAFNGAAGEFGQPEIVLQDQHLNIFDTQTLVPCSKNGSLNLGGGGTEAVIFGTGGNCVYLQRSLADIPPNDAAQATVYGLLSIAAGAAFVITDQVTLDIRASASSLADGTYYGAIVELLQ